MSVSPSVLDEFAALKVALADLRDSPPWRIDWSPLVEDDRFEIPLSDPVLFYGSRFAVIVDTGQQQIWLEGRKLKVMADRQSYRLLAHLAGCPKTGVPVRLLVNSVLEVTLGDRLESKVVSDAKDYLMQAIRLCLTPRPVGARIDVEKLVTFENGRVVLNVEPSLVKVIRPLSEQ
jgi:hypothetical protein